MRFIAACGSVSIEGDYYQVSFDEHDDQNFGEGDYLIIQRQFEMPDGGRCYLETRNTDYIGHFKLKNVEFKTDSIVFEFERRSNNIVEVVLSKQPDDMSNIRAALEIIQGKREPYVE